MVYSKLTNLGKVFFTLFFCFLAFPNFGQYTSYRLIEPRNGDEPQPMAILATARNACALIYYRGQRLNVVKGAKLDEEWKIKEIKRESIVFGKESEKRYLEYYVDPAKRPERSYKWFSFYSIPITVWEAVELIGEGFGKNVVMHNLCSGAVTPKFQGKSMMELIDKTLTSAHRGRLDGDTLYLFPVEPPNETWQQIFNRKKRYNHKALAIRFEGLAKKGFLNSRGYDIQYVLRVISLGGEVPISFPKDMHFAVYANYKNVPFSKILCDVAYTNQCIVVEREFGLEVVPWPGNLEQMNSSGASKRTPVPLPYVRGGLVTTDFSGYDRRSGSGPYPPPLIGDPNFVPSVVAESVANINRKTAPIVHQSAQSVKAKK